MVDVMRFWQMAISDSYLLVPTVRRYKKADMDQTTMWNAQNRCHCIGMLALGLLPLLCLPHVDWIRDIEKHVYTKSLV
jgi:hypothetical protein